MIFARAVNLGNVIFDLNSESAILITVSTELNIVILATPTEPARYIDVPLANISDVTLHNRLSTQSQDLKYALVVQLSSSVEFTYFLDATGHADLVLMLAFNSEKDATIIMDLITPMVRVDDQLPASQSEALNVSKASLHDEHSGAAITVKNSQTLAQTALLLVPIDGQNFQAISTRQPLGTPSISQGVVAHRDVESSSSHMDDDEAAPLDTYRYSIGIEPIDVSQPVTFSHVETSVENGQSGAHPPRISDTQPHSFMNEPNNLKHFQNSFGLQGQITEKGEGEEENVEGSQHQSEGSDELYDASPKRKKSPSKSGENPVVLKAAATQQPQTISKTGRSTNAAIEETMPDSAPTIKLSKNLRNGDGTVVSGLEPIVNEKLHKSKEKGAKSSSMSKTVNTFVRAKPRARVKMQIEPAKKAAVSMNGEKATANVLGDKVDDFDLPESPTLPVSTRPPVNPRTKATLAGPISNKGAYKSQPKAMIPPKVATTITSKSTAPQSTVGSKTKSHIKTPFHDPIPRNSVGKKPSNGDDRIWDLGDELSDEKRPKPHKQARPAKKRIAAALKTAKTSKTQSKAPAKRPMKEKPTPAALNQPRSRRAAALDANKKIQGIDLSDDIVDDEQETASVLEDKKPQQARRQPEPSSISKNSLNQNIESAHEEPPMPPVQPSVKKQQQREPVHDTLSPEASDEPVNVTRKPKSELGTKTSSPEEVDLVEETPEQPPSPVHGGTDGVLLVEDPIGGVEGPGNPYSPGREVLSSSIDSATRQQLAELDEAKNKILRNVEEKRRAKNTGLKQREISELENAQHREITKITLNVEGAKPSQSHTERQQVVPEDMPQIVDTIVKTPHGVADQDEAGLHTEETFRPTAVDLTGAADDIHFQNALPYTDGPSVELTDQAMGYEQKIAVLQAPTAPMIAQFPQRSSSPPVPKLASHIAPTAKTVRRDPFSAKLGVLLPKSHDESNEKNPKDNSIATEVRGSGAGTIHEAHLMEASRKPKAITARKAIPRAVDEAQDESPAVRPLQHKILKNPGHIGYQTPALKTTDWIETKRKVDQAGTKRKAEQDGTGRQKRAKPSPQVHLESTSADNETGNERVAKTPLLTIKKKPPVISFGPSGPRNQGTISNEKSRLPRNGNAADSDTVEVGVQQYRTPKNASVTNAQVEQNPDIAIGNFREDTLKTKLVARLNDGSEAQVLKFGGRVTLHEEQALNGEKGQKKSTDSILAWTAKHPTNVEDRREQQAKAQHPEKRKVAAFLDDPGPVEHDHLQKRHKRVDDTPPTRHKHRPQILPDLDSVIVSNKVQRPGSQSTRVNENGSPMPFAHSRNDSLAAQERHSEDQDVTDVFAIARIGNDYDHIMVQDDVRDDLEPTLPFIKDHSKSNPNSSGFQNISSNSKNLPSSPHASSAFGTMPTGHVYHDGEIVDIGTNEAIVPVKPQDPFVGNVRHPKNRFLDALRKSSDMQAGQKDSRGNKQGRSSGLTRKPLAFVDDPEKTLVETPRPQKRHIVHIVTDTSSSSQTAFSEDVYPPSPLSEDASGSETKARWRKAFEPHQGNMMDALSDITHVSDRIRILVVMTRTHAFISQRLVGHLIDRETAITDMVADFGRGGSKLVDGYEKERQNDMESRTAILEHLRHDLAGIYEKAQTDSTKTSKAAARIRANDIKAQWDVQQQALDAALGAALAACAE